MLSLQSVITAYLCKFRCTVTYVFGLGEELGGTSFHEVPIKVERGVRRSPPLLQAQGTRDYAGFSGGWLWQFFRTTLSSGCQSKGRHHCVVVQQLALAASRAALALAAHKRIRLYV